MRNHGESGLANPAQGLARAGLSAGASRLALSASLGAGLVAVLGLAGPAYGLAGGTCSVGVSPNTVDCLANISTTDSSNIDGSNGASADRQYSFTLGADVTASVGAGITVQGNGLAVLLDSEGGNILFDNQGTVLVDIGNNPTNGGNAAIALQTIFPGGITYTSGISEVTNFGIGDGININALYGAVKLTQNGTVNTSAGNGIVTSSGDGDTTLTINGEISANGNTGILSTSTSGNITTTISATGAIDPAIGIDNTTISGALTVNNAGLIEGDTIGVRLTSTGTGTPGSLTLAQTGTGTIQTTGIVGKGSVQGVVMSSVDANLVVTGNAGNSVIDASKGGGIALDLSTTGNGSISIADNTITGGSGGILAQLNGAGTGSISVTGTGDITTTNGNALDLLANTSSATGAITYNRTGNVSGTTEGIHADGFGAVSVTSNGTVTATGGKFTAGDGIIAISGSTKATDQVQVTSNGAISVNGGRGIDAQRNNGDGAITVTNNATIGKSAGAFGFDRGIYAGANSGSNANVTVNLNADVGSASDIANVDGVLLYSGDAPGSSNTGNLIANINNASSWGEAGGVFAEQFGKGNITITGNGTGSLVANGVTETSDPIFAVGGWIQGGGGGSITVDVTQNVSGLDSGLGAITDGGGNISLTARGKAVAQNDAGGASGSGILALNQAKTANKGTINIVANGLVTGIDGIETNSGLSTGTTTITVAGEIKGRDTGILSTSTAGNIITNILAGAKVDPTIGIDQQTVSGAITVNNAALIDGDMIAVKLVSTGSGAAGALTLAQTGTGKIEVTNADALNPGAQAVLLRSVDANQVVTGNGAMTIIDASKGTVGIDAQSTGTGGISIADNTISGKTGGVLAKITGASAGGIAVTGTGAITTVNGTAVDLSINNAAATGGITYNRAGNVTGDTAIKAIITAGSGNVAVTTGAGSTITANKGVGISAQQNDALATNASVVVTTGIGGTISAIGGAAIGAVNNATGSGTLTINSNSAIAVSSGVGISAVRSGGTGAVLVNSNAKITGGTAGAGTALAGIEATSSTAAVTVNVNADIGSPADQGIFTGTYVNSGAASGGNLNVNVANASIYGSRGGVVAQEFGLGDIKITGTGSGTISGSGSLGVFGIGVYGQVLSKNASAITIDVSQNVIGKISGINGETNGSGNISIAAKGNVTATAGDGISALNTNVAANSGKIDVSLATGKNITATLGNGIVTNLGLSTGTATLNIDGAVNASGVPVIKQSSIAGNNTVNASASGSVNGLLGTIGITQQTTSGANLVANAGTIIGDIAAIQQDSSGSGSDTVNNTGSITGFSLGSKTQALGINQTVVNGDALVTGSGQITGGIAQTSNGNGNLIITGSNVISTSPLLGKTAITATSNSLGSTGAITITTTGGSISGAIGINATSISKGAITISTVGNVSGGIIAFQSGSGNVAITNNGGTVSGGNAISASTAAGSIKIDGNAAISGGIIAVASGGDIAVLNSGAISGTFGINTNAQSGGNITVTPGDTVTTTNGTGISALNTSGVANNGTIGVTTAAGKTVTATGGDGIVTNSGISKGLTTITANGNVTSTTNTGITATSGGGGVTILQAAASTISGAVDAIKLNQTVGGVVNINALGTLVAKNGSGVFVQSSSATADTITVTTNAVQSNGGAGTWGSQVRTTAGTGDIVINSNGKMGGVTANGMFGGILAATGGTSNRNVTVNVTADIGTATDLSALNVGQVQITGVSSTAKTLAANITNASIYGKTSAVLVTQSATGLGDVKVTGTGTGLLSATTGAAINARNLNAVNAGLISVDVAQNVSGGSQGILAMTVGGGNVVVKAGGNVSATAGVGIQATNSNAAANAGTIDVTLAVGKLVTATGGNGIVTDSGKSTGTATVTINGEVIAAGQTGVKQTAIGGNNSVVVSATGKIDPLIGVDQTTTSGVNTVANAGLIQGDTIAVKQVATGTGTNVITNSGTITGGTSPGFTSAITGSTAGTAYSITNAAAGVVNGSINVTGSAVASSAFNNAGTWNATGASGFTGAWNNTGIANLATSAAVTSSGPVINSGMINLAGAATITTPTLTNAGTITLQNGATTGVLTIAGAYVGGGAIRVDANTVTALADQITITGAASGTTAVAVNEIARGILPTGFLPIITVTPGTAATAFVDGGSNLLTSGLISERFGQNPANANQFGIIQSANTDVVVLSSLSSFAAAVAAQVDEPVGAYVTAKANPSANDHQFGLWMRGGAGNTYNTLASTIVGTGLSGNVVSKQRISQQLIQVGADYGLLNMGGHGLNLHLGITGGAMDGSTNQLGAQMRYHAAFLGGYFYATKGGLTLDLGYHHEWRRFDVTSNSIFGDSLAHSAKGGADAGAARISYRFGGQQGFAITPMASIAWSNSRIDPLTVNAITQYAAVPDKGTVYSGGAKISYRGTVGNIVMEPFAAVRFMHNASNQETGQFTVTGIGSYLATTTAWRDARQYELGLSAHSASGRVSAFATARMNDGSQLRGATFNIGARFNF